MSGRRRHLLLLGSNLADASRLEQALDALRALGTVTQPLPVRHGPPRAGHGAWYFNALVMLASALDDPALDAALVAIEQQLGRRRDGGGEVAIDIDRLAIAQDSGTWQAHPHALAKGELTRPPAADLLAASGIHIA